MSRSIWLLIFSLLRHCTASGSLHVTQQVVGNASSHLIGAGIEDVNHELYGGLYSQMIFGETFSEPPGADGVSGSAMPTWTGLGDGKYNLTTDTYNPNRN